MNVAEIEFNLDRKLYKRGADLLESKGLLDLREDEYEELVFNGTFSEKDERIWAEIVLDDDLEIEDVFCTCDEDEDFCPHVVATLIGASAMTLTDTKDFQSALTILLNDLEL